MYTAWENDDHICDVHDNGPNYLFGLICDYEEYVRNFGYVSISSFLHGWSCIPSAIFEFLSPGENVYDSFGKCYRIIDHPRETDNGYVVEVTMVKDDGTITDLTQTLSSGDIYSEPHVHYDYQWKKHQLKESEEKPCPILITKISQLQS
jgi:hypothetical protein